MLYKFKLGHNATEATKTIFCMKSEGIGDHNTVTRWLMNPGHSGKSGE